MFARLSRFLYSHSFFTANVFVDILLILLLPVYFFKIQGQWPHVCTGKYNATWWNWTRQAWRRGNTPFFFRTEGLPARGHQVVCSLTYSPQVWNLPHRWSVKLIHSRHSYAEWRTRQPSWASHYYCRAGVIPEYQLPSKKRAQSRQPVFHCTTAVCWFLLSLLLCSGAGHIRSRRRFDTTTNKHVGI